MNSTANEALSIRLLLIEDFEDDALLLRRTLQRGGYELLDFLRVDTREAMQAALGERTWDVVIADYSMPRFDGLSALRLFKEHGLDIPFFIVSGIIGEEMAVTAMKAGAQDYIMKSNLARLLPAIERELQESEVRRARQRAEDQVRKLHQAVEQSPNAIFITDTDGRIEYANHRFVEHTGYSLEETSGQTPALFKSDLTAPDVYETLWAQLKAGQEWRGELRNRHKSGSLFWASVTIAPIRDADDQVTHYLAIEEDISERKLTEEALRESEARFRQLFNHAADAIFVVDQTGHVVNTNQQACDTLGYTSEELIGKHIFDVDIDFRPEPDLATWARQISAQPVTIHGREQRKDGSTFPVEVRVGRFELDGQSFILALARDVTERERMQAELERYAGQLAGLVAERTAQLSRTNEQLQVILNNSGDAIVLTRADGDIIAANPAFHALFGDRVSTAIEEIIKAPSDSSHAEAISYALFDVFQHQKASRVEASLTHPDGSQLDVDIALTPVLNPAGGLDGVVLSLHDITHLKEIDRFKTRFVANAAHDLAHPIASFKLHLYALRNSPERLDYHLEALDFQTRRLETLVNDLRMLSQLDRGVAEFDLRPLDLGGLVANVVRELRLLAEARRQVLSLKINPDLPPIQADKPKLERVVVNLLSNAINYTPDTGHVDIYVGMADPQTIMLRVTDSGIGIEPDEQDKIFERFYRSDSVKIAGIEGTGLGLSIVHEIVEAHQGRITVHSALGEGSIFTVTLPIATAAQASAGSDRQRSATQGRRS